MSLKNSKITVIKIGSSLLIDNNIYCLRMRENLFISPPLTISNTTMKEGIDIIDNTLQSI